MTMKAIVILEPKKIEIQDVKIPEIKENQVLVKTQRAAICGSDHPFYLGNFPGVEYPLAPGVPGHEGLGVVAQSRSDRFSDGDLVLALPSAIGGFGEYFVARAENSALVPRDGQNKEYVLAQPVSTVIHACERIGSVLNKKVAIVGQGNMGLLFTQMLKNLGARMIIAIDLLDNRLAVSRKVGASHTINAEKEDPVEAVSRITGGAMVDLALEVVGYEDTLNLCIRLVRLAGTVFAFGVPRAKVYNFDMWEFFRRQITFHTTVGADAPHNFPLAIDMVARGTIDVSHHVTHRLPFEDIQKGFEMAISRSDGVIKIVVEFDGAN